MFLTSPLIEQASLTMPADVKHVSTTLPRALEEERHFALMGEVLNPTARSISIQVGTQFDPCISSVTSSIMITTSNSSVKRSGLPTQ